MRRRFLGIVFDLDGTLTTPHLLDYARMRARINCPRGADILSWVSSHAGEERNAYETIVREEESLGLDAVQASPHLSELFDKLSERCKKDGLTLGILTRNNEIVMNATLEKLFPKEDPFSLKISRDWRGGPPKPHPAALNHMAESWGVAASELIMVGDSADDIQCSKAAGALAVAFGPDPHAKALCDVHISNLLDVEKILVGALYKE